MTGLLHRLAARALGTAPLVRSSTPTFGASPSPVDEPPVATKRGVDARETTQPDRPEPRVAMRAMQRAAPPLVVADPTTNERLDGGERAEERRSRASRSERDAADDPIAFEDGPARPARSTLRRDARPTAHDGRDPHDVVRPVPLLPPRAPAPHRSSEVDSARDRPRVPVRSSNTRSMNEHHASDEPTEVHVHIGRIDVSAVREPAPVRRKAAPAPAAMSLDAYLAARRRA